MALGAGSQAPQVEPSDAEGTPEEEVVAQGHRLVGPGLATNSIFFWFLFCEKSLICLEGQINDSSSGKHYSLPFLSANTSLTDP